MEAGAPRSLAPVTEHHDAAAGRSRRRAERLLGAAAEPAAPRPSRPPVEAPRAVRWAALVVAVEAAAIGVAAVVLLYLAVTRSGELRNDLALAVTVGVLGAALAGCAVGLWRVAMWARGPVVALQILLGLMGVAALSQAGLPAFGIPALVLAALVLYLLATPEARLAYFRRREL